MHITVEWESCVGCGQCALAVPEVFDQDQHDGTVVLLDPYPAEQLHERVRAAASNCPMEVISVGNADAAQ